MKRIISHIPNITASASVLFASVVVFASAFLLSGCSESELPGDDDNGNNNRPALTIEVSDGGYAPAAGEKSDTRENPATRATENDYTTQFTAGDKIGVYAVKDGAIVDGVNNLCLVATTTTATDGSTSLVWQTEDGKTPFNISGATYYAYYPWQSILNVELVPGTPAPETAAFFANVINNWTPSTDQGTYTAYTASDLMIAKGTTSDKKLSFSMQHQMALVVIDLPKTKYTLTDAGGKSLPDYILDAPDTNFKDITPCRMGDGTYRYLIKPEAAGSQPTTLSGSYTNATPATAEWEFKANVPASQYKKYVVDNGSVNFIDKSHQLQVGDFFMKDGTLLSKETNPFSDEQKAACIGIVLKVGKDESGDWEDDCKYKQKDGKTSMNDIHGYVLSLKEGNGGKTCAWGPTDTSVEYEEDGVDMMNREKNTGFYGYKTTQAIILFNKSKSGDLSTAFPAAYHATAGYEKAQQAPASSSGWFLPSAGQCWYWYQNRDKLSLSFKKALGKDNFDWSDYSYWSSSEYSDGPKDSAWGVNFFYNGMYDDNKGGDDYNKVLSCLAF